MAAVRPTIANGVLSFAVALREKSSPLLRSNLRVDVLVVVGRKDARPARQARARSPTARGCRTCSW